MPLRAHSLSVRPPYIAIQGSQLVHPLPLPTTAQDPLYFFGLTKWLQNARGSQTLAFLSCLYLHIGVSHLTTASSKSSRCPYKATQAIGQGAILLSVCRKKTEMKQNPPNNQNNSPEVTGIRLIGSREDPCRVLCLSTKQTLHNQLGLLQAWDLGTDLI